MQKIHIQDTPYYRKLEKDDDFCRDVLQNQMKEIRFDVIEVRWTEELQHWRAQLTLDDENELVLEMKDYYTNKRSLYPLDGSLRFSEATAQILGAAYQLLDEDGRERH